MKKTLNLFLFLTFALFSFGQWTTFSTGVLIDISCGSEFNLVGIAGTSTNNAIYRYNFENNSWFNFSQQSGVYYTNAQVASDATIYAVGNINGGGMTRKFPFGNITPTTQASSVSYVDVRNNDEAAIIIGTGLNNVQANTVGQPFVALTGLPIPAYRVSIGDDGTIFALADPNSYFENVFKYNGSTWVNIPGRLKEISVGDANKVVGVSFGNQFVHLDENQWVTYPGAPFPISKATVSGDGFVYVLTYDSGPNIRRNTWEDASKHPAPATVLNSTALSICTGTSTTINLSSEADLVEWLLNDEVIATGLSYTTPELTANTTYVVRTTTNGNSNTRNVVITVSANPVVTNTTPEANLTRCSGQTTQLSATGPNLLWYEAEDATNYVGWNSPFTTPALSETKTYWLEGRNGGCYAPRIPITIEVYSSPPAPVNVSNLGTICPGPATVTVTSDYDVEWYETTSSTEILGTDLTYDIAHAVNNFTIYAQARNGNCVSPRTAVVIQATTYNYDYSNPQNATPAENLIACTGGTTTLTAYSEHSGGVMHWSDAYEGGNVLGTGDTFETPAVNENFNVFYYSMRNNCRSNTFYMTVKPTTVLNITPNENLQICSEETTTLTASTTEGIASWFESATSETPLFSGNTYTTESLEETTTFYVQYNHPSCVDARIPVTVSVTETPEMPSLNSDLSQLNVCAGTAAQATVNFDGTLSWFTSPTGGTTISNDNPLDLGPISMPTTLNYYAQASNGNCHSDRFEVEINVQANPLAPINTTPSSNLSICEGNSTVLSVEENNTLLWFDAATGGNQIASGSTFNTPELTTTTSYFVESQVLPAGCISETRTAITVVVNEIPAAPVNALGQNTVCEGSTLTLSAEGQGSIQWFETESSTEVIFVGAEYTTTALNSSTSYFASSIQNGCESSRTEFSVLVNPSYSITLVEEACVSFDFNGTTLTESGTYTANLTTAEGCDSLVTLNLTILNPTTSSLTEVACDEFTWNGQTYTSSGVYTQVLTNAAGCDSTITLNLTINHPSSATITETACLSFVLNGEVYTESGVYVQHLTTVGGCDSTLILNLTISDFATSTINQMACTSFTLNGETYMESGTYTQTLTSYLGCDSIITLNLTINHPTTSTLDIVACDSYELNGELYTTSGTYTQSLVNEAGCDSTLTLNLTIHPSVTIDVTESACSSFTWNSETYTESGVYTQVFQTVEGCDSTVTLNLTIAQPSSSTLTEIVCGSFTLNGETYTETGIYTQVIPNTAGCDSTITLDVTILPTTSSSVTIIACDSFEWNGEVYTTTGTYTQIFQAENGCDSTVTLDLTIHLSQQNTENITTCGDFEWNGTTYTESGMYTANLQTVEGCDSTATLVLQIATPSSSTLTETACGSYALNGETYTVSGTYTQVIPNAAGCDSTITLNLTILQATISTLTESACNSFELNGETYTSSGTYTQVLTNAAGCDSTLTLNLTITTFNTSVTQNEEVLTANQTGASYQWIDCANGNAPIAGETSATFTATENGSYAVIISLNGCEETSACVEVTTLSTDEKLSSSLIRVFPNPATTSFTLETAGLEGATVTITDMTGKIIASLTIEQTLQTISTINYEAGVYNVIVSNENSVRKMMRIVITK